MLTMGLIPPKDELVEILTWWCSLWCLRLKFLLEYCLKQFILDAGSHKDWPVLVSIHFLPQIEKFQ